MHHHQHHEEDPIIEDATEWTDEEQDPSQFPDPYTHTKIAPMKSLQQFHASEDVEDVSEGSSSTLEGESAIDRIIALKYMLPLRVRTQGYRVFVGLWSVWKRVWSVAGAVSWVVTTSLILVGLPMFIEYDREQGMMAFEKEQQKADQLL